MLLGEAGLGIQFDERRAHPDLGFCALVVIIAEGGLTARWSALRPVLGLAAALATVGVAVSVAVGRRRRAPAARPGLAAGAALRRGAVVDRRRRGLLDPAPAAGCRPGWSATLEAESGINDAPVVLLVVLLSRCRRAAPTRGGTSCCWSRTSWSPAPRSALVGRARPARWALRRAALPSAGLYPLAAVGLTVLAYAAGAVAHASGFLAVYVAGRACSATRGCRTGRPSSASPTGWPGSPRSACSCCSGCWPRPAGCRRRCCRPWSSGWRWCCWPGRCRWLAAALVPFRVGWREQAFLSWAGLRGAVPIVLATIPLSRGVPGADGLFDVVFVLVVVFTLVQAQHAAAGRRAGCGVTAPGEATELRVETAPLDRMRRRPAAAGGPGRVAAGRRARRRAAAAVGRGR